MPIYTNYTPDKEENIMGRTIEVIVLLILIAITSYYYVKARKESYEKAKEADAKEKIQNDDVRFVITAKIEGMMCERCASRVTENLCKFGDVKIDLVAKTATITSDSLVDVVELENTINELGFKFEGIVE